MELKIKQLRIKHNGVVVQIYYSLRVKIKKAIIFAYGLPSAPLNKNDYLVGNFIEKGFLVACPQYMGTYDSEGEFSLDNCVESINATIDLLNLNKIAPEFNAEEIVLCGGSFGASIVLLCASKEKEIKKVISIAVPLNWTEKDIKEESEFIEKLWKYTHRIKKNNFKTLLRMDLTKIISDLEDKKLFLIHGKNDKVVDVKNSFAIFNALEKQQKTNRLLILEEEHIGCGTLCNKNIFEEVIEWLK
ncbi:MAG: prolyl oligopeptidase family serine peptidase [Candidatus Aenigmarchaeota archaeon]|nr:prolyl oligopeptidase family serine peptidase [Candidatus Aenigmarchaeota archaeon]